MTIIQRYAKNPILTKRDIPYPVATVYNAGVVKCRGKYIMLFRSNIRNGRSIIGLAESNDGYYFQSRKEPFLMPNGNGPFGVYEEYGVEDPRITYINGDYLITYSVYSRYGVRNALARTKDFESVEKLALITPSDQRNVVIFPEKFHNLYVRLDRPHQDINAWGIWISYSPDLIYWGRSQVLVNPVHYHWDEMKMGPGAPPIRTEKGWLNIFHGAYSTINGTIYRLGVALHDLDDPSHILGIADNWILEPEELYETTGYVPNVVFTCGAVPEEDGSLKIYWGAADSVMCMGEAQISDLVELCLKHPREPLKGG
ncbi:MAG: glycoside hydrolase family 130 protein [Bacteroidota bacterium]